MFEDFENQDAGEPIPLIEGLFKAGLEVYRSWQLASREDAYQMQRFAMKSDQAMEEAYADL